MNNVYGCRTIPLLHKAQHRNAAFSLVELSVVLVILGMLTGGVLTGQSLIRASELRAVTTEYDQIQTALSVFEDKYFALPGDMPNATEFWGSAWGATCPMGWAATGDLKETCNGNGNGRLNTSGGNMNLYVEMFMFWQHLANAGLIQGQYVGSARWHRDDAIIGFNVPPSKLSNAGWTLRDDLFDDHVGNPHSGMYGLASNTPLQFGGDESIHELTMPVFTPEEAWSIDKKIDDGNGSMGKVVMDTLYGNCRNTTTPHPVQYQYTYKLDYDGLACALLFLP
jgi:prepilin-type N-terminal cleavage/methylation domain-containing protein